jgi:predicted dehydrogenase
MAGRESFARGPIAKASSQPQSTQFPEEVSMRSEDSFTPKEERSGPSRRRFLGGAMAVASAPLWAGVASAQQAAAGNRKALDRKIKVGLVGCGGRGSWIIAFFKEHGGYEIHAVADYFHDVADRCGDAMGVDKSRRFSGLSGYKKLIESGVEAVVLKTPPCFFQEHASAAVAAGLHVYMAKPVAVDVPGCVRIEAAGKLATQKQRVFLVDLQMPTDPVNIQVAELIRKAGVDKLAKVATVGVSGGHPDEPKKATIESRLRNSIWDHDIAMSGGWINVFDIHAIDAAIWALGKRPIAAMGTSRICRSQAYGDSPDVSSVVYEYADGMVHSHSGQAIPNGTTGELSCVVQGETWRAVINYWGKARFQRRSENNPVVAEVVDLYAAGAKRNVAAFYESIAAGRCDNPSVRRAVDSCLTCILGREAAARRGRLTMAELLKENKRIELDLSGLKVS